MTVAAWLDRLVYAHPFEGAAARRYEASERPAFGDLDDRLLDGMADRLVAAGRVLDVGAGPGTFVRRAAARHPHLAIIAVEPSRAFGAAWRHAGVGFARARGEALPIATAAIDVAICLSAIRHVRDRGACLRELRRVVRPGGTLAIVELDPAADRHRIRNHAERLGSTPLRLGFGPLVVRTAPRATAVEADAIAAGWRRRALVDDPIQPVYVMELE